MLRCIVATLGASVLLGACGGFLEDEPTLSDCRVGGVVQDDRAQPLAGVLVSVRLDRLYEATSDSSGRYELVMPANYRYPAQFAGTVTNDSYLPRPVLFSRFGVECPSADHPELRLRPLTASDILFPQGSNVTHLGDGTFAGDVNSQLQVPSSGLTWSDGFTYTAATAEQPTRLCVSFLARGVQSVRQNRISVSRAGDPAPTEVLLMSDTDPSGGYSEASYCFSLTPFTAGDRIDVTIESGKDGLGVLDYDDFEFVSVVGTLLP